MWRVDRGYGRIIVERKFDRLGFMETVKVSSKYQVVIPRRVREALDIRPGQAMAVMAKGRALEIVPVRELASARGMLKGASPEHYRDRRDRF